MILVGELSLWVALLMAAWGATVSFAGGHLRRSDLIESGERAIYATLAMVVLASIGLWTALLTHDFSIKYVASFTSANLPVVYTISAFWGGQSGSLLFWALILAIFCGITLWTNRTRNRELMPYVSGTLAVILAFFLATICLGSNPYERLDWIPPDGRGLNPQLQNPGMAIHPPNLYFGYISTSIPFAFAIAALLTRRLDAEWLAAVRRWALFSWFFLTVGITLGMWWAYVELGWGGYWAWDPVENASLLPWLVNTAFLHSIMVQEKRGMLRKWNVTLVASAFLLSIFGTFITRSGVISSVHSFAQSTVGWWFAGFLVVCIALTAYLVTTRLEDLRAHAELESMLSREAAFLYNNLVLIGIAFSVLWGTIFPILSEAVRGEKITVGPPFFNTVNVPLGLLLLLLTGIGPLIAWRRASVANLRRQFAAPVMAAVVIGILLFALGVRNLAALLSYTFGALVLTTVIQEFSKGVGARHRMYGESRLIALPRLVARNRRRYGGYIVHVGVVILFAAFAGMAFKSEYDLTLKAGESKTVTDPWGQSWTFLSQGVSRYNVLNREVTAIALDLKRDGKSAGLLTSEKRQHVDTRGAPTFEPSTEVGIKGSFRQDVYVVLAGVRNADDAEIRVSFNPLVRWVWMGGALMAMGGLIVMWPAADKRRVQSGYIAVLKPQHLRAGERVEELVNASLLSRRDFLLGVPAVIGGVFAFSRAHAQAQVQTFNGPMADAQEVYRPVKLAPKAGASPSMTPLERDDLEHNIKCQCGCNLDVFTCRTTDFSCSVSPAMHSDVLALVEGGYDAPQILAAFQSVYGERVLMAPVKSGFNLLGYTMPFIVLGTGAVIVAALIRRWKSRAPAATAFVPDAEVSATHEELARLDAAVRRDA